MNEQTKQLILSIGIEPPGYCHKCPNCDGKKTYFSCLAGAWLCLNCGIEFQPVDTTPCYDVQAYEADERIAEELLEYVEELP